jgi:hypothetical protein
MDNSLTARAETDKARQYMVQLCKHMAHKMPAETAGDSGTITFGAGVCRMSADDTGLTVVIEAAGQEDRERLAEVVERHINRFAFREPLSFAWSGR